MTMDATSNTPFFDFVISEEMSSYEAAVEYFRNGRKPVFTYGIEGDLSTPEGLKCVCNTDCGKNAGKHPIRKNWPKPAETEEALRDEFLSIRSKSNVGLILGEQRDGSYLVAVDVDDETRVAQLELELGVLPRDTATCESARGYRLFYRIPEIVPKARLKNRTALSGKPREGGEKQERIPGVDVKVGGGQVVVAPSLHISGKRYVWSKLGEVLTLPVAWCEPLLEDVPPPRFLVDYTPDTFAQDEKAKKKAAAYLQKAVTEEAARLAYMPEGMRNDYLYRKAIRLLALANSSYSVGKWEYVLRQLENAATFAGLARSEVRRTLASAERYVVQNNIVSGPRPLPVYDKPEQSEPVAEAPRATPEEEPSTAPPIALIQFKGQNAGIVENIVRLLRLHPEWNGGPALDNYADRIYWSSPRPEPVADRTGACNCKIDRSAVQAWCLQKFSFAAGLDVCEEALRVAAKRREIDSLMMMLDALPPWDGVPRIDRWLTTYFGCKDTKYNRTTGRSWLRACVERAYSPGIVVDMIPVLVGPQGSNKNYALETLFKSQRLDAPWLAIMGEFTPDKFDFKKLTATRWIIHDDEFKGSDKRLVNRMKSWVSQINEQWMAKWDNDITVKGRRALLVCSTNEDQHLYDHTGNRRWVRWEIGSISIAAIERDREQLFAEAKQSPPWRDGLDYKLMEGESQKSEHTDPLRERLIRLANEPMEFSDGTGRKFFTVLWDGWKTASDLANWLGVPTHQADEGFSRRLGHAVSGIGGETRRTTSGSGKIRFYKPPPPLDQARVRSDLNGPEDLSE
jgi:Virulence-associated protein E/Bifunctional DNA primase/polymerase, N-terminal